MTSYHEHAATYRCQSLGSTTTARGSSRPVVIRVCCQCWPLASAAIPSTSMRSLVLSVQYRLLWIQSNAMPPIRPVPTDNVVDVLSLALRFFLQMRHTERNANNIQQYNAIPTISTYCKTTKYTYFQFTFASVAFRLFLYRFDRWHHCTYMLLKICHFLCVIFCA